MLRLHGGLRIIWQSKFWFVLFSITRSPPAPSCLSSVSVCCEYISILKRSWIEQFSTFWKKIWNEDLFLCRSGHRHWKRNQIFRVEWNFYNQLKIPNFEKKSWSFWNKFHSHFMRVFSRGSFFALVGDSLFHKIIWEIYKEWPVLTHILTYVVCKIYMNESNLSTSQLCKSDENLKYCQSNVP